MSMDCPKCGALAKCMDSRRRSDHTTVRRYRCTKPKCIARWSTVEQLVRVDTRKLKVGAGGGRLLKELADRNGEVYRSKLQADLKALLNL